ncbi:MAG: hypothetical protein LBG42_07600 [Treponema sp.]|nr:hypothetical protein [Treponema sp.]
MASSIPANFEKFDEYYKNYCQIVTARTTGSTPVWTHIPAARVTGLNEGYAAWYTAWSACIADKTKAKRMVAKASLKAGTKIIEKFSNEFIRYSSAVSDEDCFLMGVHRKDPVPTPTPVPATRPGFTLRVKDIRKIRIDFWDLESALKARPYGMDGAVIRWVIMDHPATDVRELINSVLATRTPFYLEFTDADRGKILSVAIQWQNKKGQKGAFSEIQSTVVP